MSSYTIPNVIAQHPRGERIMDVYSHLLTERIVYLGTAIDPGVANALVAKLLHLEAESQSWRSTCTSTARAVTSRHARAVRHDAVHPGAGGHDTASARPSGSVRILLAAGRRAGGPCCPRAGVLHQPDARGQGPTRTSSCRRTR